MRCKSWSTGSCTCTVGRLTHSHLNDLDQGGESGHQGHDSQQISYQGLSSPLLSARLYPEEWFLRHYTKGPDSLIEVAAFAKAIVLFNSTPIGADYNYVNAHCMGLMGWLEM